MRSDDVRYGHTEAAGGDCICAEGASRVLRLVVAIALAGAYVEAGQVLIPATPARHGGPIPAENIDVLVTALERYSTYWFDR